jgi:hypothetical protein
VDNGCCSNILVYSFQKLGFCLDGSSTLCTYIAGSGLDGAQLTLVGSRERTVAICALAVALLLLPAQQLVVCGVANGIMRTDFCPAPSPAAHCALCW